MSAIYYLALPVGADSDAPAQMGNDDIHFLVFFPQVSGKSTRCRFLVQGMKD